MARRSNGESALHKHLRVLETFDAWRPFLTLAEIATSAGLPRSTAHRLVAELEREGLVERLPDRTYRLGVRLWEFASRTPGAVGLREIAHPWLAAVHARVREHIQLAVRRGTDVLYIDRLSTRHAVINATVIGGRMPMHASASGLAILAYSPPVLIDDVVRAGLRVYTDQTIRSASALRAALERARRDGYAVADGHVHPESRGISVPILGPDGTAYAAVALVVPCDETHPGANAELLRRAAAGIERDLAAAYRQQSSSPGQGGLRSLMRSSDRSLEYLEHLAHDPHDPGLGAG